MDRLWRPAAQRNVRNVWSSIAAARSSWSAASAKGLAAATGFVNAFLTTGYLELRTMDLGVLEDMPGLRSASIRKLATQQSFYLDELVSAYQELENAVSSLISAAKSMRIYVKSSGSLASFSQGKVLDDDPGDGNGIPVFSTLAIRCYEDLALEVAILYLRELKIKWYIASKLLLVHNKEVLSSDTLRDLFHRYLPCRNKFEHCDDELSPKLDASSGTKPTREALEISLTFWLAETKIEKTRIDEVLAMVNDEIFKG